MLQKRNLALRSPPRGRLIRLAPAKNVAETCAGSKGTLQHAQTQEYSWFLRARWCIWDIKRQYIKFNVGLTVPFQILKVFR